MKKLFFPHHKIILVVLLTPWILPACKKLIQIPANPPTEITQAQQFSDSATITTALAGIYTYAVGGQGFTYNDGLIPITTGLSSDELITTETDPNLLAFYNYGLTSLDTYASSLWADPYTGLYPVNATLNGVINNTAISTAFQTQVIGELKVVQALYYFNLVNLFGAVPLVTSNNYSVTANLPRTSVDSIYSFIQSDLSVAVQDLTPTYPSGAPYRPNLYVALFLQAKVDLYQQQWQNAYNAADTVISSGLYTLGTDLTQVFLDGSSEAIWQIPATGPYSVTTDARNFVFQYGAVPNFLLTPNLLAAFEPGDQRLLYWTDSTIANTGSGNQTYYYPYKYKNVYPGTTTEDYMVFRLGELYLIRAEAAAELGNTSAALADLNQVRARAGLAASTASGQTDILAAIMRERQVELFTEWGNRWYDLKRTGTAAAILTTEKTGWQTGAALYPVPRTQLLYNQALTQNPGY